MSKKVGGFTLTGEPSSSVGSDGALGCHTSREFKRFQTSFTIMTLMGAKYKLSKFTSWKIKVLGLSYDLSTHLRYMY